MNAATPATRSRVPGRIQFVLLAVLFFTPFVAAWMLYFYFPDLRPSGTTNYGELVSPIKPVPEQSWTLPDGSKAVTSELNRKWTVLQLGGADCDAACGERVLLTRQLRTALNADRERVQRVLLVTDAAALPALQQRLAADHGDLLLRAEAPGLDAAFFGSRDANALYLIDPLGNYLMLYPDRGTQSDFKGLQKDLKKLLKLSQSG